MPFINLFANTSSILARAAVLGWVIVLSACSSSGNDDNFGTALPRTTFLLDYPAISPIATTGDGAGFTNYGWAFWNSTEDTVDSLDFSVNDNVLSSQLPAGENPYAWQYILGAEFDPGINTFSVTANIGDFQLVDGLQVTRGTSWMHEVAIQYDENNARWLLLDKARRALLTIDLSDGKKTLLSAAGVGAGTDFSEPVDFVVDAANNRALVVDKKLAAVIEVALVDDLAGCDVNILGSCVGDRTVISDTTTPDANTPFKEPVAIELGDNQNAYIADRGHRDIIEMELAEASKGQRVLILGATNAAPAQISIPLDLAFHASSNYLFVTDRILQNVIAIDLNDGARTAFDDANPDTESAINFNAISHLLVDQDTDTLYVSDTTPGIIAIALTPTTEDPNKLEGLRSVLSDNQTPNCFNIFVYPGALAIDKTAPDRLLAIDNLWGVLVSVELTNIDANGIGHKNYMPGGASRSEAVINSEGAVDCETYDFQTFANSGREAPALGTVLQDPRGLVFYGGDAAALDRTDNKIVTFDLSDGFRGVKLQLEAGTAFIDPRTLATDGSSLYVVDVATDQVVQVNSDNTRTLIPAFAPTFEDPVDAILGGDTTLDSFAFDTLYVLDKSLNDVIAVNLLDDDENSIADGERSALGLGCLVEPVAIEWHPYPDENVSELLILDRGASALFSVDLTTVTPTCTQIAALPPAVEPVDLALDIRAVNSGSYDPDTVDAGDWSALILDAANSELFAVGIGGDNRGDVAPAYSAQNNANDPFISPVGLIFDSSGEQAYVLDDAIASLYAIDLLWRRERTKIPLTVASEECADDPNGVEPPDCRFVDAQRVIFSRGTSLNCDADEAGLDSTACDIPGPE